MALVSTKMVCLTMTPDDESLLFEAFLLRLAERIYPVPNEHVSEYERDRRQHRDLAGLNRTDLESELFYLRIRRRLLPDRWLDEREAVLEHKLGFTC